MSDQAQGIYIHGQPVTEHPVHGGLIPVHGGTLPVHGSNNVPTRPDYSTGYALALDFSRQEAWVGGVKSPLSSLPGYAFTRTGIQGAVDKSGAVQWFGTNTVLYSQALTTAPWASSQVTVTANAAVAPDGTMTATRVQFPGAQGVGQRTQQLLVGDTGGKTVTVSMFVRSRTVPTLFAIKNTHNNVQDNFSPSLLATTEWQRFSYTVTNGPTTGQAQLVGITTDFVTDLAKDLEVWQIQMVEGAVAGPIIPTTGAAATAPAINDRGYHAYGALTNVVLQSQNLGVNWTPDGINITADAITAPDGTMTADRMNAVVSNTEHRIYQTAFTSQTISVFAKMGTARYLFMTAGVATNYTTFDLQAGTVVAQVNCSGYIVDVGGGWFRCITTRPSGEWNYFVIGMGTTPANAIPGTNWLGAGETVYLWQANALLGQFPDGGPLIATGAATAGIGASAMLINNVPPAGDFIAFAELRGFNPNGGVYGFYLNNGTWTESLGVVFANGQLYSQLNSNTAGTASASPACAADGNGFFYVARVGSNFQWGAVDMAGVANLGFLYPSPLPVGMNKLSVATDAGGTAAAALGGRMLVTGIKPGTYNTAAKIKALRTELGMAALT